MIIISSSKKTSRRSVKIRSERDGQWHFAVHLNFLFRPYEIEGFFLDTDLRPCSFKISDRTGKGEEGGEGGESWRRVGRQGGSDQRRVTVIVKWLYAHHLTEVLRAANLSKGLLKGRSPQVVASGKDDVRRGINQSRFPLLLLTNNYLTYREFSKYLYAIHLRQCHCRCRYLEDDKEIE